MTCKELGQCHSHPHNNKKAELTENQSFFLGPKEVTGQTTTQKTEENREQRITSYQEQKPPLELATGRKS